MTSLDEIVRKDRSLLFGYFSKKISNQKVTERQVVKDGRKRFKRKMEKRFFRSGNYSETEFRERVKGLISGEVRYTDRDFDMLIHELPGVYLHRVGSDILTGIMVRNYLAINAAIGYKGNKVYQIRSYTELDEDEGSKRMKDLDSRIRQGLALSN